MEKRDRYVDIFLHRSSDTFVLVPGVCYMAGVGIRYGKPVMSTLAGQTPQQVGKQLTGLLDECKHADIDAMTAHRKSGLRAYWSGEKVSTTDLHPIEETAEGLAADAIHKRFPAILKGPAAILREFAWARLVERHAWKSRRLTQQVKSEYRGCVTDGKSIRLPNRSTAVTLGTAVIEFVREC